MKILYHHRVGSKDGQSVHIDEIVAALRGLGHVVIVASPEAMQRAEFGSDAGAIAFLKKAVPSFIYELLELAYSLRAFWRLCWIYWRERPDVLYERYNLYMLAGVWLKRLTGIPMLLEVNAPLVHERSRFSGLANQKLAGWIEGMTWRAADIVLPVTNVLAGFLREARVAADRIVVVQNGIGEEFLNSTEHGSAVRSRYRLGDKVVLGFTGFVRDWHGLDRVIDLIAESDPQLGLALLVVGSGPAMPHLQQLAAARGIEDRVIFVGLVARQDIVRYVSAFDVALQPRVVPYASPLKLFEYMALGRAIVAPSAPNIREVLSESEALLFDPDNPTAFSAAVERLSRDPALREELGMAARQAVKRQGLTWENNARRIVALFQRLILEAQRGTATERPSRTDSSIAADHSNER